jgi:hypothetical protein
MAATVKKLVVSNSAALRRKYGMAGLAQVQAALKRLVAADKARAIRTTIAWLDQPATGIPAVTSSRSARQAKRAIDSLYSKHGEPDYVMLLGAPDVVPHVELRNPVYAPGPKGDPDTHVPSDLPYACDAPYGLDPNDFLGPTRVVGRLADQMGSSRVADLVGAIDRAASFKATPPGKPFVLSADVWKSASRENARLAFGATTPVKPSPPRGPGFVATTLRAPVHFINCHGDVSDPAFYGDPGMGFAHQASSLPGRVVDGAIVVAECCYGAELYAPVGGLHPGMANTYLHHGAIAYCGSTTIAYGEAAAVDRCHADILCTEFLASLRAHATTGRALLEAQQRFLQLADAGDATNAKTLAQFLLLGDPSLRPYPAPPTATATRKMAGKREAPSAAGPVAPDRAHAARRKALKSTGRALDEGMPRAHRIGKARMAIPAILRLGPEPSDATTLRFRVEHPAQSAATVPGKAAAKFRAFARAASAPTPRVDEVRIEFLSPPPPQPGDAFTGSLRKSPLRVVRAEVVRLAKGEVISRRRIWSK